MTPDAPPSAAYTAHRCATLNAPSEYAEYTDTVRRKRVHPVNAPFGNSIAFGAFRLFSEARLLERDGQPVPLGSRAIDILTLLVERAGEIVSKRDLVGRAWPDLTVEENSLRVQIAAIRKALGDGIDGARYISNVAGRGYCFVAPTRPHAVGPSPMPGTTTGLESALPVVARLVGRDEVMQRITFLMHSYRFVTICGPGGMGKTSVAARVAERSRSSFDGVVFLDLASIQDPALVASSLGSALGLLGHATDPMPAILAFLRQSRVLVVFDSCERVIEAAALLAERISQEAPSTCIVATSREPLLVAGEHVVQLAPLAVPPLDKPLSAVQVLQFPAARLFADRAIAAGLPPDLSDSEAPTIAFICRALDGIPLAIEIAASRAGRHGIIETAQLLDGRFLLSWRGRRSATPRQQSLHSTLDWSFELLSPRGQAVLQELSLFPAKFGLGSAEALVGEPGEADASTRETIEDLVAKSLISVEPGEGARYRLLDTTRAYARAKLDETGRTQDVARRHAQYVAEALAAAGHTSTIGGGDPVTASDLLADLRAALTWSFGDRSSRADAVRLCAVAAPFFIRMSLFDECRRWLERALPMLEQGERGGDVEMRMEDAYGTVLMLTQSNSERSQQAIERAIELAHQVGDARTEFRMLNRLGLLHRRTAAFDRLLPIAERAEAVATAMDDRVAMASARLMRGSAHALRGDQKRAHPLLEEALSAQLATPPDPGHFAYFGDARIPLSFTLWLRGFADQAAAAARIISADTDKDVLFSSLGLSWGAILFQALGDHAAAAERAMLLRAKAQRYQLVPYEAVGLGLAGEALLRRGELSEAVARLASAVDLLRANRYGLFVSIFGRSHANAMMRAGLVAEAAQVVEVHTATLEAVGGSFDLPEWLRIRAEVQWRTGAAELAESSYRDSIALAEQQGALAWHLRSATSLARLLAEQGRTPEAIRVLELAIAPFEEGFATPDLVAASTLLGEFGHVPR